MTVLTERTYVNADGTKVVPGDSPEAHSLLGLEGDEISDERAKALGIKSPKVTAEDETPKRPELNARAKELGIPATGTNVELAAAIAEAEKAAAEATTEPAAEPES
jgi:hypothetical protein